MDEELMEELDGSEPQNQAADTDKPYPGILDDDPALDITLLNEMEKEHRRPSTKNSGCAGVFFIPGAGSPAHLACPSFPDLSRINPGMQSVFSCRFPVSFSKKITSKSSTS